MGKKIKVAIVYHCIAHYREPIFRALCLNEKNNIEYTLISGTYDHSPSLKTVDVIKSKQDLTDGGLRWRIIGNTWFAKKILWQKGLVKLALSKEFDVIIYLGSVYYVSTWVSCFIARMAGRKTLMWSHGFLRMENGLKGWVRSHFYKLSDGMLLYHNRAKEIFIEKGFDPNKLDVLYNSLNVEEQKNVRCTITEQDRKIAKAKLFNNPDSPTLLWIGRLTATRKLGMVLEAVEKLSLTGNDFNVLIIGDGPEKNNLQMLVAEKQLNDRVVFYGACHDENELGPLISMSDLCVAPGEVGLTCMHSLVYGTPVMTHDNPDCQGPEYEAINPGLSGEFFKFDDVNDFVRKVKIWSNWPYTRDQIRENCYKVIDDHYNPENQVRIINNVVLRIV